MTLALVAALLLAAACLVFVQFWLHPLRERLLYLMSALSFVLMVGLLLLNATEAPPGSQTRPDADAPALTATLEQASLRQWQTAARALQSATAYAVLVRLRQEQVFKAPIRSVREYTPWVQALEACLRASGTAGEPSVYQVAAQCVQNEGLKRWR